jgi:hypothetical protein
MNQNEWIIERYMRARSQMDHRPVPPQFLTDYLNVVREAHRTRSGLYTQVITLSSTASVDLLGKVPQDSWATGIIRIPGQHWSKDV